MTTPDSIPTGGRATSFPPLPIITLDPPPPPPAKPKTEGEKYGSFRYFGVAGLVIALGLVGWFGWNVWAMRDVWTRIYVIHDPKRSEGERIEAAYLVGRDPRVTDAQRWDMAMRKPLPPLARYVLAESITPEFVRADPVLFAKYVALSDDWPEWLRLLCVRAMTVAAFEGVVFPADLLDAISARAEPSIAIWIDAVRAVSIPGDALAADRLQVRGRGVGIEAELARDLTAAIEADSADRSVSLEKATRLLRIMTPETNRLWSGWIERDGRLVDLRRPQP